MNLGMSYTFENRFSTFKKNIEVDLYMSTMYFSSTSRFRTDKKELVIRNDNFSFKD